MSKASEAGKAFMAGVLAKLPESVRGQAEALFTSADAESALEVIGTGALAQPEINRKLDELRTAQNNLDQMQREADAVYQQQTDWWAKNQPKVEEFDRLKPEYDRLKAGKPSMTLDTKVVEDLRKEFGESLSRLQTEGANVMAFMTTLGVKHFREFGTEPDLQSLLTDKQLGKPMPDGRTYGLVHAYEAKYGEQIKARATKAEDDRIGKLVEERLAERMKTITSQPFPLRNQAPSALDILETTTDSPDKHTVDSATALYEQLQAARG